MSILAGLISAIPGCTHQKNELPWQMNIFASIMVFNVLPRLIENELGILDFTRPGGEVHENALTTLLRLIQTFSRACRLRQRFPLR